MQFAELSPSDRLKKLAIKTLTNDDIAEWDWENPESKVILLKESVSGPAILEISSLDEFTTLQSDPGELGELETKTFFAVKSSDWEDIVGF